MSYIPPQLEVIEVPERELTMQDLEYWLTTPTNKVFKDLWQFYTAPDGSSKTHYAYIDNGADVLAVAHLDTVQKLSGIKQVEGMTVCATGLDDRLGAWAVMNLLPYRVDILLTDHEEIGQSTAQYFSFPKSKKYKYCMQFDRCGVDVVTYDLDNSAFRKDLKAVGAKMGIGSYTDLCYLPDNYCAVNFGTGYYDAHGVNSYAHLDELNDMVALSAKFYDQAKYYGDRDPDDGYKWWQQTYADNPAEPTSWQTPYDTQLAAYYCCMCGTAGRYDFDWPLCDHCSEDC